jgi:hypothetical protein
MSKDTEIVPGITAEQWERMTFGERIQSVPEYYRPVPGILFIVILFTAAFGLLWYAGQTLPPPPAL